MIFLVYCLCICVVSCPYVTYYPTVMVRYSLFVLKVSLNTKQTNKQTPSVLSDLEKLPWKLRNI